MGRRSVLGRMHGAVAVACAVGAAAAMTLAVATPALANRSSSDPATELAEKYAPIVRLVAQTAPCGYGEPYQPTDVDTVLPSADVVLRGPWDTTNVVRVAPTGADLAHGLDGYHLDFPGDALHPGCTYEQWSRRINADAKPTVYAHIATDPEYPGRLALQYWFFYVYNDWNNKHEGDWEMIQLNFDAGSPEMALQTTPTDVGYSQHEGAERAHWGDDKLTVVDATHPVVYPAMGSHANYYGPHLYLGRSAEQGVGCDNTVGPSREIDPVVAVVPTDETAAVKKYPWLGYAGRWGEKHSSFYNGPTGPNTKSSWTAPFADAADSWRDTAYAVPGGGAAGRNATTFFCAAVAGGSNLLTALLGNPTTVGLVLIAIGLFVGWLATRTRWSPRIPLRVARRRDWGALVTSTMSLYRRRPRLFLRIGLLFIPLGLLSSGLQYLLFQLGGLDSLRESAGTTNAAVELPALFVGLAITLLGFTIVQAVTAVAVRAIDTGEQITAWAAYRQALPRLPQLVIAVARAALVLVVLALTVVGPIVDLWLIVLWSLVAQVVVLEPVPPKHPLRRSGQLVRSHWWRTASLVAFVTGLALILGPLLGSLVLLASSASFDFVNLISSVIYVATLPFAAIATTYLYYDLLVREQLEVERPTVAPVLPAEI